MKTHFFFICLFLWTISASRVAAEAFPASDQRITWIGRTETRGNDISFDWSGVYAIVRFTGNCLQLHASDSGKDYLSVWYDKDDMTAWPDTTVCLEGPNQTLTLFEDRNEGAAREHRIIVQKRTEGSQGMVSFHEFIADGLLQARPARKRVLEFVGDSYTCGYGTLSHQASDPFTPETEDCGKSYAGILSRYFGADYWIIAHSGLGVARNYADNFPDWYMPDRYCQTFDVKKLPAWSAKHYGITPALTVIYLATNDVSSRKQPERDAFVKNYLALIRTTKEYYGAQHPVLCIVPQGRDLMYDYIKAALQQNDMKNVSYMVLTSKVYDRVNDLGSSAHPNYSGHQKIACAVLPYIATLTGWPMENIPLQ